MTSSAPTPRQPGRWDLAYNVSDEDVWALRRELRVSLVEDVRRRLRASWKKRGAADAELAWTDSVLDPDVLTIGFARRVPTYKRLTLMLREPERLKALLLHKTHPIQLVIAGKSHPADDAGKKMIQDLVRFTDDPAGPAPDRRSCPTTTSPWPGPCSRAAMCG